MILEVLGNVLGIVLMLMVMFMFLGAITMFVISNAVHFREMKVTKYKYEKQRRREGMLCVVCSNPSDCQLKHKTTGKLIPFCKVCVSRGFYNKDLFIIVNN